MIIGLGHYLSVAAIVFTLGVLGIFLNRKNVIIILMSIELILLSVNINLVAFSTFLGDIVGQVYALIVLTVAAAEAAIGLAILVAYFRNRGSIAGDDINLMKGGRGSGFLTAPPPPRGGGGGGGGGASDREAVPPHPSLSPLGRGRRKRRRR